MGWCGRTEGGNRLKGIIPESKLPPDIPPALFNKYDK